MSQIDEYDLSERYRIYLYVPAVVFFIFAIEALRSPERAKYGNLCGFFGFCFGIISIWTGPNIVSNILILSLSKTQHMFSNNQRLLIESGLN